MRVDDLDAVYALEIELFPNPWPKAFFVADLRAHNTLAYVVEDCEHIIAYCIATYTDEKLHVTNVAVDRHHQRRGIASRFMVMLEHSAAERGYKYAYLEVRTNNEPAIELYKRLGYDIKSRRDHYYIDGDDAYVMEKELK
jgi:ribosomal-protein-alanine N-acetyltransferase